MSRRAVSEGSSPNRSSILPGEPARMEEPPTDRDVADTRVDRGAEQLAVDAVKADAAQVRHRGQPELVPEGRVQRADAHAAFPREVDGCQGLVGVGLHVGQHGLQARRARPGHVALEEIAVRVGHREQDLRHHEGLQLLAGQRRLDDAVGTVQLPGQELHGGEQAPPAGRGRAEAVPEVDGSGDGTLGEVGEMGLQPRAGDLEDQLLGVRRPLDGVEAVGQQDDAALVGPP